MPRWMCARSRMRTWIVSTPSCWNSSGTPCWKSPLHNDLKMDDAIDHLNALAAESAKVDKPMRTTEELREFFKNPPKRAYSVPLEEAMAAIVEIFRMADENGRRAITSKLNEHARHGFLGYAG